MKNDHFRKKNQEKTRFIRLPTTNIEFQQQQLSLKNKIQMCNKYVNIYVQFNIKISNEPVVFLFT